MSTHELEGAARKVQPLDIGRPLRRLLEALLPRESRVAVLTSGDSRLLALEGCRTLHFPQGPGGRYSGELDAAQALQQLAELRAKGVEFLVVPSVAPSWLDGYPDFLEHVGERYGMIARRERVCTVYELNGHGEQPTTPDRGDERVGHGLASQLRQVAARLRNRPG